MSIVLFKKEKVSGFLSSINGAKIGSNITLKYDVDYLKQLLFTRNSFFSYDILQQIHNGINEGNNHKSNNSIFNGRDIWGKNTILNGKEHFLKNGASVGGSKYITDAFNTLCGDLRAKNDFLIQKSKIKTVKNDIRHDIVKIANFIKTTLEKQNIFSGYKTIKNDLSNTQAVFVDYKVKVLLNNIDVTQYIYRINITVDENSIHNTFSAESFGSYAFNIFKQNKGKEFKIQINDIQYVFTLEEVEVRNDEVSLWGRDKIATTSGDKEIDIYIDKDRSAKELLSEILDGNIVFEMKDFTVAGGKQISQYTAAESARDVLKQVGAILRAEGDVYKARYKNRQMPLEKKDIIQIFTTEKDILSTSYSYIKSKKYNAVTVVAGGFENGGLKIDTYPETPTKGKPFKVYIYGINEAVCKKIEGYFATDGTVSFLGTKDVEKKEDVSFENCTAHTSYPIKQMIAIKYIGKGWSKGVCVEHNTIRLKGCTHDLPVTQKYRIARVKYISTAFVFHVDGVSVDEILFAVKTQETNTNSVKVTTVTDPKKEREAPSLYRDMLKVKSDLITAGKQYLSDNKYDKEKIEIETIYKKVNDGDYIRVVDYSHNVDNVYKVNSINIIIDKNSITQQIEAERCLI